MIALEVAGIVVLLLTVLLLGALLPRGGRTHRFVGTELEPYVAVLLTGMVALSFTMILAGILQGLG
ncbi:MAG: hypothetical protein K2X43_17160 [Hyphomonadaceae bacterium]|jgi:hypothetical protein|nr:hypothetical protein [Hyphomonadaceae bacterium]